MQEASTGLPHDKDSNTGQVRPHTKRKELHHITSIPEGWPLKGGGGGGNHDTLAVFFLLRVMT